MVEFLQQSLSEQRWLTYKKLSETKGIEPEKLYKRNLEYSKELYVILSGLEVVVRNSFHQKLIKHFQKEDWFSLDIKQNFFRFIHKKQMEKSIKDLTKNKNGNYTVSDIVAELNFGFWVHLINAPYEQIFWATSLRHCFPNKFGKPVRQDIEARLKELLTLRNKIAHLEPIIKNETQLMQAYRNTYDIISWICPKTADYFDEISQFKQIWNNYNKKDI